MKKRITKAQQAELDRKAEMARRFARAITSTRERHERLCMSRDTYRSHTASLWGQVAAAGLTDAVKIIIEAERRAQ